jgi:hypothetical protein
LPSNFQRPLSEVGASSSSAGKVLSFAAHQVLAPQNRTPKTIWVIICHWGGSRRRQQCGLGVASFILSLGAPLTTMLLMLILITTIFIKNDFPVEKPEPFSPVMIIYMIPGIAEGVALSLGLSCFLIGRRKQGLATAGVCISAGILLLSLTA